MLEGDFALFNVDHLITMAPEVYPGAQGPLGIIGRAALVAQEGKVVWAGPMKDVHQHVRLAPNAVVLNTHGRTVLPGFVDAHTHLIFAGDRTDEFYARTLGSEASGEVRAEGVMRTIEATRGADESALLDLAYERADTFLRYGITTVGAKTGYSLSWQDEERALQVLNRLQHLHRLKVIPQLLPPAVLPPGESGQPERLTEAIIQSWLPAARNRAEFVAVWNDEGPLSLAQNERILHRARELGFKLSAQANQLGPNGGARQAAELGAVSVGPLLEVDKTDLEALARHGTVAVLQPGVGFYTDSGLYAPARQLLEAHVPVALATGFNPGTSPSQSMSMILTLGVLKLHMTAEEVLWAATVGGARALHLDHLVGSLAPCKYCDFSVFRVDDYHQIPASYGMNLVETVVANGQVVAQGAEIVPEERAGLRAS